MKMSTQERMLVVKDIEVDNIVASGDKPKIIELMFIPSILVFQNFKPNEKVIAKFTVKNISKVPNHNTY